MTILKGIACNNLVKCATVGTTCRRQRVLHIMTIMRTDSFIF